MGLGAIRSENSNDLIIPDSELAAASHDRGGYASDVGALHRHRVSFS